MCHCDDSFDSANPAMPANASCANDVCPPNPVSTTSDRARTAAITVVMIAPRHSGPRNSSPTTAKATATPTLIFVILAGGTAGSFHPATAPRSGSRSPSTTMATMITRKGNPSRAPYFGNQLTSPCTLVNDDCTSPMARPAPMVGQMLRSWPSRAAPRAGMKNPNVNTPEESWIIGDARMATNAPTTDANPKLSPARNSGENRSTQESPHPTHPTARPGCRVRRGGRQQPQPHTSS